MQRKRKINRKINRKIHRKTKRHHKRHTRKKLKGGGLSKKQKIAAAVLAGVAAAAGAGAYKYKQKRDKARRMARIQAAVELAEPGNVRVVDGILGRSNTDELMRGKF